VLLIGNLTRDPEVRHTPKGTAVGDLGIAINSSYRAADGTEKEEVVYADIVVWGRQAETCKEYLSKGSSVFVEGRLQLDQWESPQGEKKSRLRIRAERVQFLSTRRSGGGGGGYDREGGAPSRSSSPSSAPSSYDDAPPHDRDDEVPF
jgi:single-strand DNA-binding protein